MRIGVNCFLLQPHIGGMKTYFHLLFERLLETDAGNQYVFFHFPQNRDELARLKSDRWREGAVASESQDDLDRHWNSLDLYFCPFGALWPRPAPVPSVVTVHDIQEEFLPRFFSSQARYERESHFPSSTRAADRVVAVSRHTRETIVARHGVPSERIVVAPLAADPVYADAARAGRRPDNPPPFERYVFFPANRWPHKNHDLLLRAIRKLSVEKSLRVNAVLTGFDVAGGYPLLSKAAEYGIAEQVHSVGYVTLEQMAYLYAHAEMLVFPSLFEGFGLPVLEAMAAGCPCAVSNVTSLPEIAGDAALLFDPSSVDEAARAIERIWTDRALRSSLAAKGIEQASSFSAQTTVEAHLEAFRQAASSFSRARYWWFRLVAEPRHKRRTDRKYAEVIGQSDSLSGSDRLRARFSRGWHPFETDAGGWLRWCSGVGEVLIDAEAALDIRLEGEWLAMEQGNDVTVEVNRRAVLQLGPAAAGFQRISASAVPLTKGRNRVRFISRRPPVRTRNDPRRLAVAVRNLVFKEDEIRGA